MNSLVFCLLSLAILSFASSSNAISGKATYFDSGMSACGNLFSNGDMVAAVGVPYWSSANTNNDPICGRTATLVNRRNGHSAVVRIEDQCVSCGTNNIDLSRAAFQALGEDLNTGVFDIDWHYG